MLNGGKIVRFAIAGLLTIALGCVTPPDTRTPIDVALADLKSYWIFRPVRLDTTKKYDDAVRNGLSGYVAARVIITREGIAQLVEIIESEPNDFFLPAFGQLLQRARFEPSSSNDARIPVRTIFVTFFSQDPAYVEQVKKRAAEAGW
jgi:hypothetical protein